MLEDTTSSTGGIWISSKSSLPFILIHFVTPLRRYLIRIPESWNRETGPDPVVFLHGLGLGIWQYQTLITHFLKEMPDIPILIPIQPQISQDFFHPRYLKPMLRDEKVECLKGVLQSLGWVIESEKETKGVTVVSHSK